MENELDELYALLASKMVDMIPVNWNQIYYLGEVGKERESWSSVFYFEDSNTLEMKKSHNIPSEYNVSENVYEKLLSELNSTLLDIYTCFDKYQQPLWEQLNLSLNSEGALNIDFKYDVVSEDDGGQLLREIVWAYKVFGWMPKAGTFTRKLLDAYLEKKI
ncbi:immunity protein YezG family protein [Carnobacterium maltaromaticum]|uniref:immunity protein YezG family protein n=1 Tax=Carnobacterium maltaromaticum TaxID=2751 RepID=UPI0012F778B6|nr:immunity protein YezG family protein [Carnobacterium maltaromaticum]